MGDGPEQEEDGQAAGDSTHEVDAAGGGMGVVAEEEDEEAAEEDEEGGAGWVRDLQLIATRNEFTAVPETSGGFHGQYEHCAGDQAYYTAHNAILAGEATLRARKLHVNKLSEYFFLVQTECRKAGCRKSAAYI